MCDPAGVVDARGVAEARRPHERDQPRAHVPVLPLVERLDGRHRSPGEQDEHEERPEAGIIMPPCVILPRHCLRTSPAEPRRPRLGFFLPFGGSGRVLESRPGAAADGRRLHRHASIEVDDPRGHRRRQARDGLYRAPHAPSSAPQTGCESAQTLKRSALSCDNRTPEKNEEFGEETKLFC